MTILYLNGLLMSPNNLIEGGLGDYEFLDAKHVRFTQNLSPGDVVSLVRDKKKSLLGGIRTEQIVFQVYGRFADNDLVHLEDGVVRRGAADDASDELKELDAKARLA